jgi:hypothetical protein
MREKMMNRAMIVVVRYVLFFIIFLSKACLATTLIVGLAAI